MWAGLWLGVAGCDGGGTLWGVWLGTAWGGGGGAIWGGGWGGGGGNGVGGARYESGAVCFWEARQSREGRQSRQCGGVM